MIIVKLVGGLGNQMFQYALGRHLSQLNQTVLKLDTSYLLNRRPRSNMVFRDFDLPIFNIKAEIASQTEIAKFTGQHPSLFKAYWHRIMRKIQEPNIIRESQHSFDPLVFKVGSDAYLAGYWQSEKYFSGIETLIRSDFTFKNPILKESHALANRISKSNAVCLNVRRTDFVTNPESSQALGFTGIEYYQRAMRFIEDRIENVEYFIFSDDLDWCRKNLQPNRSFSFVDHEHSGEKFHNYLHLMTLCKHYIIPNSTFGWWGAWLNENPGKIVITPRKWFSDVSLCNEDLIPKKWIAL